MTAAATAEAGLPGSAATLPRSDKAGRRIQIATTVVALAIVAVALAPILIQAVLDKPIYDQRAVLTLGNFVKLFTFPELRSMAVDTLLFCAMAIAFSMVIGVALAILLGRTDTPAAGLLLSLLLWPLFISPLVIAFGAIMAYGPSGVVTGFLANTLGLGPLWNLYTIPGIAVISGITMVPATILYCLSAARQQDPAHEAAGRVVGASPARILWRITLPMMRPALIYSTVMNIVAALEMLAIPLILGAPVGIHLFTTFIYERGFESGSPDYGLVAAAAVVLMGLISVLLALQNALLTKTHRFVSIGTRIGRPAHLRLGRWRWVAFGLIALYLVLAVGIIVGTVVLRSFTYVLSPFVSPLDVLTIKNFTDILAVPVYFRSVVNTLAVAAITGTLGTAFFPPCPRLAALGVPLQAQSRRDRAGSAGAARHHGRARRLLRLGLRAGVRTPAQLDLAPRHRLSRPLHADRLWRHRAGTAADFVRFRSRRPRRRRRMVDDCVEDRAADRPPRLARVPDPARHPVDEGICGGGIPLLPRQRGDRLDHADALGAGPGRAGGGARRHPDHPRDPPDRRGDAGAEGEAQWLILRSPTS